MDLREEVTKADALDAVAVVQETIIFDTLADLVGGASVGGGHSGVFGGGAGTSFGYGVGASSGGGGGGGGGVGSTFGQPLRPAATNGGKKVSYRKVVNEFMSHLDKDVHTRGDADLHPPRLSRVLQPRGCSARSQRFRPLSSDSTTTATSPRSPVGGGRSKRTSTSMHGSQRQ